MQPVNGRRTSGQQRLRRDYFPRQNNENAEIISYVCDSWNKVVKDYRNNGGPYVPGVQSVLYYQPTGSNNRLASERAHTNMAEQCMELLLQKKVHDILEQLRILNHLIWNPTGETESYKNAKIEIHNINNF